MNRMLVHWLPRMDERASAGKLLAALQTGTHEAFDTLAPALALNAFSMAR